MASSQRCVGKPCANKTLSKLSRVHLFVMNFCLFYPILSHKMWTRWKYQTYMLVPFCHGGNGKIVHLTKVSLWNVVYPANKLLLLCRKNRVTIKPGGHCICQQYCNKYSEQTQSGTYSKKIIFKFSLYGKHTQAHPYLFTKKQTCLHRNMFA